MYKLMLVIAMLFAQQSRSLSDSEDNDKILALLGLPGVRVVIEDLNEHAKAGGLSASDIQKDVVERLQRAGIHILTDQEYLDTPGNPILGVTVTVATFQTKLGNTTLGYACEINVTLDEVVYLERHLADDAPRRVFATVWEASQLWMAGLGELPLAAKRGVREKIDDFCRDIRRASKLAGILPKPAREDD